MTLPRKTNVIILAQLALAACVLLISRERCFTFAEILIYGGAQVYLLLSLYLKVSAPLRRFTQLLKLCLNENESSTEILDHNAENVVFGRAVHDLITKCLAQVNKDNYTIIHHKHEELADLKIKINQN